MDHTQKTIADLTCPPRKGLCCTLQNDRIVGNHFLLAPHMGFVSLLMDAVDACEHLVHFLVHFFLFLCMGLGGVGLSLVCTGKKRLAVVLVRMPRLVDAPLSAIGALLAVFDATSSSKAVQQLLRDFHLLAPLAARRTLALLVLRSWGHGRAEFELQGSEQQQRARPAAARRLL